MTTKPGRILVGTSGWSYDHWTGPFYPDDLENAQQLAFCAERFPSVEINNSFYQLPGAEKLQTWREAVPADFVFAVKASRYITHMKKLKDADESVSRFMARLDPLQGKLGPVLFQLPPKGHFDHERLETFLQALDDEQRHVIEFRDQSWINEQACELLAAHGVAFCIYELAGFETPRTVTAEFVYVRLHGPDAAYEGCYDDQSLAGWAGALSAWARQGLDAYCYFDNDQDAYAALNAVRLQQMLND